MPRTCETPPGEAPGGSLVRRDSPRSVEQVAQQLLVRREYPATVAVGVTQVGHKVGVGDGSHPRRPLGVVAAGDGV